MTMSEIGTGMDGFQRSSSSRCYRCVVLRSRDLAGSAGRVKLGLFTKERRYLERMEADPFDFVRGYEWGLDIDIGHRYNMHPRSFPGVTEKLRADRGDLPFDCSEKDVARWVDHLKERLSHHQAAQATRDAALKPTFMTTPFILPNPLQAFLLEYGIADGEVYIRKSFGGLWSLGPGPSLRVERVADTYADGGRLWGDVVFGNETGPVVKWKNVFRPAHTLQSARQVLQALQVGLASDGHPEARLECKCPFCAETILVEARLCKHCHQRLDQGDASV